MLFKKYKVYYKNKLLHHVNALSRKEAVNKAKYWFYKKVEKGELSGKVRLVLTLDNPDNEIKFTRNFNTHLAQNNFFLKRLCSKLAHLSYTKVFFRCNYQRIITIVLYY